VEIAFTDCLCPLVGTDEAIAELEAIREEREKTGLL
jgi:hypothetical protein